MTYAVETAWADDPPWMVMHVTGYNLGGLTASGTPTGPGVCAVDTSMIPLGSIIDIPRLGKCRAEDTGPDVSGYWIDFWSADPYSITGWYRARVIKPNGRLSLPHSSTD